MTTRTGRRFSILFAAIAALAKTGSAAARREFLRSARVLAAVACLALVAALALPGAAQAQSVTTLVSNTGQPTGDHGASIGAQPFTTGSAVVLTSVGIYLPNNSGLDVDDIRVRILQDDSGSPGTALVTLLNPTAVIDDAVNTFTAPAGTNLAAGTTYYVELSKNGDTGVSYLRTVSHLEDAGGATDWEIGDTRYFKSRASLTSWFTSSRVMMIAIKGTAAGDTPTPSTDATLTDLVVNDGSTDLTLDPAFAPGTETYTASVVSTVAEVTVTPSLGDSGATIEYLDASDATLDDADDDVANGHQVALAEGDNVIKVKVTAEDTTTTQTYTVTVNRAAQAQSVTTLVSNTGHMGSTTGSLSIGAQPFTTGSAAVLTSVDVHLGTNGGLGVEDIRVRILQDDSGSPGTELVTLPYLTAKIDNAVNTFTAPAGTNLAAGTTYYVEVTKNGALGVVWSYTSSHLEDDGGATGWEIGDTLYYKNTAGAPSWSTLSSGVMVIAIKGTAAGGTPSTAEVTIAADQPTFTGRLDWVTFTLTRTGDPAAALDVAVALTQDQDLLASGDLAQTVTFGAGNATATLTLFPFVSFQTVTQETTLTATVEAGTGYAPGSPTTASTRIVAADPAVTASIEEAAYTFAEDATDATVAVILRTATGVPSPNTDILVVLSTEEIPGQAVSNVDYTHFSLFLTFQPSDFTSDGAAFTARQEVTLAIVDDLFEEPDETVTLALEPSPGTPEVVALHQADGTACRSSIRCDVTVTITDNDPSTDATLSGLSLGTGVTLDPAFASGTETYTAAVGNAVDEVTVKPTTTDTNATPAFLTASDTALADADGVANGHQVALAEGDTVFKVKVTAEDTTTTQTYTVTVTRAAADTPDDFPADTTTTGQVDVGGSVTGTRESIIDRDWFKVELEAGTRYQFDVEGADTGRGNLADPHLWGLYDAGGQAISGARNNDGGVGKNGRVIYTPTADGTYYIAVSSAVATTGTYTVSVIVLGANGASEADTDFPATTATTGRVEVGASATGNLTAIDSDWFRVDLEAGKTYQFDLEGEPTDRGILEDPFLTLYDDSSNAIVTNDDASDTTLNSQIVHTVTATGIYYLEVNQIGNTRNGTYTLSVRDITPTTCTLNPGDIWCGVVTPASYLVNGVEFGHGFVDGTPDTGALSDEEFSVLTDGVTNSYTIRVVFVGVGNNTGSLSFSLTSALTAAERAKLDLHVEGRSDPLAFSVASESASNAYVWTGTGLDWSSGDPVTLRLRALPDAPTDFTATVGDTQVTLGWDPPGLDSGVTGHEFRYKTDGDYPATWTAIANSGPDEANEDGFTVTGLTNEVAHTFELHAVNASGAGAAATAGPVTPTPGICGRTQQIQDAILAELSGVDDCAAVTVANLASITTFGAFGLSTVNQGITSLQKGDFAGLTALTVLNLSRNTLTSLPEGIFAGLAELAELNLSGNQLESLPEGAFDGLVKLEEINLASNRLTGVPEGAFSGLTALIILFMSSNDLSSLPEGLFSGLTALKTLGLNDNDLSSLPEGLFSGLTALVTLGLQENALESLPEGLFSGLTALRVLELYNNALESLPDGLFSDLTALTRLELHDNALDSLPEGLFSGLTALDQLFLDGNSTDPLPLTVTVEKVGTNQVRAKVLAGAPVAVDIPVTPVNGTLAGSVTELGVAAGSVDGTAVTMTRTAGTTAAVTVDVDLTTQPTLSLGHRGYIFKKATTNLPVTIIDNDPSTDATLSALAVNDGSADLTLDPAFAPGTLTYAVAVGNAVDEVTVTPTTTDTNATPEFLDASDTTLADADTVKEDFQVALAVGDTVFKVQVTAEDTTTTQTYTVTVTRAAQAQEADVLVSNIGQSDDGDQEISNNEMAVGFTTGGTTGGYTLGSIEILIQLATSTFDIADLTVTLWNEDPVTNDRPGSSIATLTNPGSISANEVATFTAPTNTTLAADTDYFVHLSHSGLGNTFEIERTNSSDEDNTSAAGWKIHDERLWRTRGSDNTWNTSNRILKIRVNGTAAGGTPPPPSTDATLSGLSLGTGVTLDPAFAPGTLTYTAAVGNAVDEVTVTPTTTDTNATPEFLNASDATLADADGVADGQQVALAVGDTVIKVQVTAEDTTTTQTYTVTVTRAAAGTATVTIAADQPAFTGRLDNVIFTLTRTEDPAAALDVTVALTQDQNVLASGNLAQTVTFGAGNATATLTLLRHHFQTVTQEATLTATVQAGSGYAPGSPNTASTRIVAADPAVTASIEETAYTFAEDATVATVAVILRTATGVPVPNQDIFASLITVPGQAESNVDYTVFSEAVRFRPSDFTSDGAVFTARKERTLAIVDDALYEPDETLTLRLEHTPGHSPVLAIRQPDGGACRTSDRCDVTVTITDNDPFPDATLSGLAVRDGSTDLLTTFAPGTLTYAVTVANSVDEVTVTPTTTDTNATVAYLNASDTTLDDADGVPANGHQVALAEGDTVFKVQVTAEDTTTTQTYTVTVTRAAAGTMTVAIAADQPAFTAGLDIVTFTLTRTGDAAAALDVALALTQDQDLLESATLAQTVSFGAGDATATLTLFPDLFRDHTATQETTLTATVQAGSGYAPGSPNMASTRMLVTDPAVTVWIEQTAYTFAEDATDTTVAIILRTATGVPSPNTDIYVSLGTRAIPGQAVNGVDYERLSVSVRFRPSDFTSDGAVFTARQEVTLAIVDDLFDEPDETLTLELGRSPGQSEVVALRQADGTVCPGLGCDVTVTITDNDDPAPSAAGPPPTDDYYLWTTTITVGESSTGTLGYDASGGYGELSTGADFFYPTFAPPPKHHFDPESALTVTSLRSFAFINGDEQLRLNLAGLGDTGNVTLWIGDKCFPVTVDNYDSTVSEYHWPSTDLSAPTDDPADLEWEEDDRVRVTLVYERARPSAPTYLTVKAPPGEDGTLEVRWEAPDTEGTFPTTHYLVEFLPVGDPRRVERSYVPVETTSVTRTDLQTGVEYRVLVQALSGDGYGSEATRTITTNGVPASCAPNPGDLWCGVVTVGHKDTYYGYNHPTELDTIGDLSDTDFDVGLNSYTIAGIFVYDVTAPVPGTLAFVFHSNTRPTAADLDTLVLQVGGRSDTFAFSDAFVSVGRNVRWDGAGLDWSEEDYVILRLRQKTASAGAEESGAPLTAAVEGLPEAHDGESAFTFRIAFSEAVAVTPEAMRTGVLTVTGGAVTGAARVDGEPGVWAITVTLDTRKALSITLAPTAACDADGAVCTADGRALSIGAAHLVSGPP